MADKLLLTLEDLTGSDDLTAVALEQLSYDNLFMWLCSRKDLKIDHKPFDLFNHYRYMIDIYSSIDAHMRDQSIVVKTAAQMGKTVFLLIACMFLAGRLQPSKIGFYFPTDKELKNMVKDRLTPFINSMPDLVVKSDESNFKDNLSIKSVGDSSIYLASIAGKVAKDGVPLDVIIRDERRLMLDSDAEQVNVRTDASPYNIRIDASTPNFPGVNIDKAFQMGTQHRWHIKCSCKCPDCGNPGRCLEDHFPECMILKTIKGQDKAQWFLRCPYCGDWIRDGQNGAYYPHNPNANMLSFGFSQLTSHHKSPTKLMEEFALATDKQNFVNQKLGLAYVDKENKPITPQVIDACTNTDYSWWKSIGWETREKILKQPIIMGIDHMTDDAYVIVGTIEHGMIRLIHLEIIETHNPMYFKANNVTGVVGPDSIFTRIHQLMSEFKVDMCLIDSMPNGVSARGFGRSYPGKVFLVDYDTNWKNPELVQWMDRPRDKAGLRKATDATKYKWKVRLNRYLSLQHMFARLQDASVKFPDLRGISQQARSHETGHFTNVDIGLILQKHLFSVVRKKEYLNEEETDEFKMKWINLGLDPHFVHAMTYLVFAADRAQKRHAFVMI